MKKPSDNQRQMENIYFYPHEFEEVKNALDKAYAQIFITKRISNFIELHGRNSFTFLIALQVSRIKFFNFTNMIYI